LFVSRFNRDNKKIALIEKKVAEFLTEVDKLKKKLENNYVI